jgi:hypothetical protein
MMFIIKRAIECFGFGVENIHFDEDLKIRNSFVTVNFGSKLRQSIEEISTIFSLHHRSE